MVGPALFPLQHSARCFRRCGRDARMGDNPPATAGWADCSRDYPAQNIKSPYPYKTAKEHYEALMAEAVKAGGPTKHTKSNAARLGRLLYAERSAGRSESVAVGKHQSGEHDTFAAHSGIPEAHGSGSLSRGRDERAAVERLILLSGRSSAVSTRNSPCSSPSKS